MEIKASDVAKLREMTGVGLMESKRALVDAGGDLDKAVEALRKSGAAKAAKKADRSTAEGRVHTYTHANGKIAVVVEVLCETDFVARNESFIALCHDIAMHIAAMSPLYTNREEVPVEVLEKEKDIFKEQLVAEGKPVDMLEKIVQGKINKYFEEVCLVDQPFVKDEDITVNELLQKNIGVLGENLKIGRFKRIQIGA